jgi:hypothetical protein
VLAVDNKNSDVSKELKGWRSRPRSSSQVGELKNIFASDMFAEFLHARASGEHFVTNGVEASADAA